MNQVQIRIWQKWIGIVVVIGLFGVIAGIYTKVFWLYWKEHRTVQRVFGATYMTMNNEFYKVVNNQIRTQVEKKGDHLITLDPALDQEKQNAQMQYLVKKKVDAIFLNPVDWKGIEPGLKAAKKAGIPVIVIDTPVYREDLISMTIVSDNYQAGVQCAKAMMKKKSKAKIVLLTHQSAKSGVDRIQGFLDTIRGHREYQVLASADTQGQIERSLPKVEKIIQQYNQVDVIMALNDPAAMGALAALDSKNARQGVLVYGVDGSPEGKKLILDGMMEGTSAQSPKKMAGTAIQSAYKILDGKTLEKRNVVPVQMITRENVEQADVSQWQ